MRDQLKSAVERMMIASGIAAARRRGTRGRALILAFHNVVPDDYIAHGDSSLHLPVSRFARHLDTLARLGDVVPLTAIHDALPASRARFAITFDDAYVGALSLGVAELRRRRMPATVFVAPGLLGRVTWWDMLANPNTGAIPTDVRDHALHQLAGLGDDVLEWARRESRVAAHATELPRIATLEQLRDALTFDGLMVGSHTWSHANLAALDVVALERELRTPADWLRAECGDRYVPWLSYPYGLSATAVERAARDAGYSAAVRVEGGWHDFEFANRFAVPRYNVPRGLSERGFVLRLSGIGA